jgi:hypothetical protein
MSKYAYSLVGLAGIGAAGWVAWNVGEELYYQSIMRPVLEEAAKLAEQSSTVRRVLGPPPYQIHGGGRNSIRPIFRQLEGSQSGQKFHETAFWVEGPLSSARMTVACDDGKQMQYVYIDGNRGRFTLYRRDMNRRSGEKTLFGYLASLFLSKK